MRGVDYGQADTARRYSQGRALPDGVLDRWQAAAAPHLPDRASLGVLDLGAGTGTFARAWPTWAPCRRVATGLARMDALDPSAPIPPAALGLLAFHPRPRSVVWCR